VSVCHVYTQGGLMDEVAEAIRAENPADKELAYHDACMCVCVSVPCIYTRRIDG
jgi:hypothetical protein